MLLYRRDFGRVLTWGVGGYWYDFAHGWYHFDRFRTFAAETERIDREAAGRSLRSRAEIAVILDEESIFDLSLHANEWGAKLRNTLNFDLERLGTPVDFWLASDLALALKRDYKLLVFPVLFRQNPQLREQLSAFPGHVLFLYGAGMVSPQNRLEPVNCYYGIPVGEERTGLVENGRRFYWPGVSLPEAVWTSVLTRAGVHRFTDRAESYIYANESYLGIWIPEARGGRLTIAFPDEPYLIDAETGKTIGSGREVSFPLPEQGGYFRLLRRE